MFDNENTAMPFGAPDNGDDNTMTEGERPTNLDYSSTPYQASYNIFHKQHTGYEAQCTWHCYGRAREAAGKTIEFSVATGNDAGKWHDRITNYTRKSTSAAADHSIAVWAGHVAYVEAVSGNNIYFTEANYPWDDALSDDDGIVKVLSKANFENHCSGFIGYVHLK